jgi:endonuclease/exonuclease/phosphatase family metal-dependent hydrolase
MTTLSILTWNIWMMPFGISSPSNLERAVAISDELLKQNFDILCLEKAFDERPRRALEIKLGPRYPYRYGPVNGSRFPTASNGGVWVLSRIPLTGYREIQFRKSAGIERIARKGALFLEGKIDGRDFQLVATHLQGDDAPFYDPKKQEIRDDQMAQMASELIAECVSRSSPLFICGDFCTPRREGYPSGAETQSYQRMIKLFGVETGPEDRITLDDNPSHNDVADDGKGRIAELDYIFVRQGPTPVKGTWERHIFRRQGWDRQRPQRQDLSYRYAVSARFEFT